MAPLLLPPRQQYTSGRQPLPCAANVPSMWRAMFFATSAAPRFFASKGETCLYMVPIAARSASSSTGQLIAPGTWSSANSEGERTSMTSSNSASCATVTTLGNFTDVPNGPLQLRMRLRSLRISPEFTRKHRIPTESRRHECTCRCSISPHPVLPWRRLRLQDRARRAHRAARGHADARPAEGAAGGHGVERRRRGVSLERQSGAGRDHRFFHAHRR